MAVRPHLTIFKTFFKSNYFLTMFFTIFMISSFFMARSMEVPEVSMFGLIAFPLVIVLMYGTRTYKRTEIANEMIDYIKETKRELTEEQKDFLTTGIVAKNWLWVLIISLPIIGVMNKYFMTGGLSITYFLYNLTYFISIIYGASASTFMKAFTDSIGLDLIEENMEGEEK